MREFIPLQRTRRGHEIPRGHRGARHTSLEKDLSRCHLKWVAVSPNTEMMLKGKEHSRKTDVE